MIEVIFTNLSTAVHLFSMFIYQSSVNAVGRDLLEMKSKTSAKWLLVCKDDTKMKLTDITTYTGDQFTYFTVKWSQDIIFINLGQAISLCDLLQRFCYLSCSNEYVSQFYVF